MSAFCSLALVLGILGSSGCTDTDTMLSSPPKGSGLRSEGEGGWMPFAPSFTTPTPQIQGQGALGWTPTPFVLERHSTRVRIRVTGSYQLTQNPAMLGLCLSDGLGDHCVREPIGPVGPQGIPYPHPYAFKLQTFMRLRMTSGRFTDYQYISLQPMADDPFGVEAILDLPAGVIEISRNGFTCYYWKYMSPATADCYQFSGSQQVTVEVLSPGKIKLECAGDRGPNLVTRGKEVVCTASKDPATATGEVTVTGWSFNGVARSDGDPTSLEWRGVMVRGGTVQVTGKVGSGPEQPASATIEVVDREWPDVPTMHLLVLGATGGEDRVRPLAANVRWASDLGAFSPFGEPPPGEQFDDPIKDVQGGPNDGLNYFADLSFPVWGRIRINDAAMREGSAFFNAQERPTTGGGTQIGGQRWCSNRVVTSVLPGLVRAHEERHVEVYRQRYGEVVRAVLPELERLTGTYSELADRYEAVPPKAHADAYAASWAIHNLRGNPNVVTPTENGRECNLKSEAGSALVNPANEETES